MPHDPLLLPAVTPEVIEDEALELEPRYRVLIHNDDVTTFEYVIRILGRIFLLSHELADHIAWTTHQEGQAVVVIRPRAEAERLAKKATNTARVDGFPLTFSVEPDE
jgi:ATP-dependent Clp protease adaptor protein ClpS